MTVIHYTPEETKQIVAELFEAKYNDDGRPSVATDSGGQLVYQLTSDELRRLLVEFATYYDNFFEGEST